MTWPKLLATGVEQALSTFTWTSLGSQGRVSPAEGWTMFTPKAWAFARTASSPVALVLSACVSKKLVTVILEKTY